jgi:hypothetical protein
VTENYQVDYGRPRDDLDDSDYETSHEEYDKNGDSDEEDLSDIVEKPWLSEISEVVPGYAQFALV